MTPGPNNGQVHLTRRQLEYLSPVIPFPDINGAAMQARHDRNKLMATEQFKPQQDLISAWRMKPTASEEQNSRPTLVYQPPSEDFGGLIRSSMSLSNVDVNGSIYMDCMDESPPLRDYPSDFQNLNLSFSTTYFSLFHINLNSLDAHLDDLQTTLASLNFPFHIIGISETSENYSTGFKMNNNPNGFTLFSQPSRSAAGGVAIHASKSLNAFKRISEDLNE